MFTAALAGRGGFGLKIKKIRPRIKLPPYVLGLIQTKNQLCRMIQEAYIINSPNLNHLQELLENTKSEIRTEISRVKLKRRTRLRMKLLKNDPSRKRLWSFLNNKFRAAGSISGTYNIT